MLIRERTRRIAPEHIVALGAVAFALTVAVGLHFFWFGPERTDFYARYNEGIAWRTGAPLYTLNPSLNTHPPIISLLLFAPLSFLPYPAAQVISTVLNVVGFVASVRVIARTIGLSRWQVALSVALLSLTQGMLQHWATGQFVGYMLYPATKAWAAYRSGDDRRAGLWLAPLIVAKPPVALLGLLLGRRVAFTAGVLSASLAAVGILATGWAPWEQWVAAGSQIDWVALPLNASLWGLAGRWQQMHCGPLAISDLNGWAIAFVAVAGAGFAWHAWQQSDRDLRFFCSGLWSVLLSPLGWPYYLALVFGPAVARWPQSWPGVAAYTLLLAPVGENTPDFSVWSGSIMCVAVCLGWFAWTHGGTATHAGTPPGREPAAPASHGRHV